MFIDLSESTMALIFMSGYSYWLCKFNDKQTPFEVTRQDKISLWANISKDAIAGQPLWSIAVVGTYIRVKP